MNQNTLKKLCIVATVSYFAIFDANFAQQPHRVIEICDEINRRNLKPYIDLPTGLPINSNAKEMVDALANVGLIRKAISIESGDAYIRNRIMMKNIKEKEIFEVIEAIRRYPQIFLLTDFVLGMPQDTVETLDASCQLIANLDTDDIALSVATPYPGTELYRQCEHDKLFVHGVVREKLWMANWFSHVNINRFIITPYKLNTRTLCDYRDCMLAARALKISMYRKRMKTTFNVDSNYGEA